MFILVSYSEKARQHPSDTAGQVQPVIIVNGQCLDVFMTGKPCNLP
jgi:hypothetical protein